jgi:DNA primase
MRFSPALIERLRAQLLVSEVIGRRIAVKKHGREFHACCPFHNEKTPSFTINDDKGFFHCFGCGAHGDAIEFIRRYERLTYGEAVEALAREGGIEIAQPSPEERRKVEQEKTLYDVLESATLWFEKQLNSSAGMHAKDYAERRGLRPDTIRQFRIGYAPEERTALHAHLTQAGFSQELQVDAGLIIVPEAGGSYSKPYDRFRGRLMFPIRNASGKVVAFGGRLLASNGPQKNLPKYLNSPETALFKKGEMLFNLDQAKRPARDGNLVVVMEGYMDVVMSAQAGVSYAVATLGTAVTPDHLRMLWHLAKEPVMCLDGDNAGKRAMLRAAEVALPLLKPGFSMRYAMLPEGEDPDSYVQKQGKASFEKLLLSSKRLSQVMWDTLQAQFTMASPESRAALDDACQQLCSKITDPVVRQHYLTHFKNQLWKQPAPAKPIMNGRPSQTAAKKPQQHAATRSVHVEHMVVQHHSAALESLSQRLLRTLLQFPKLLQKSHVEEALSRLDIRTSQLDGLRNVLLSAISHVDLENQDEFIAYVQARLPDGYIGRMLADTAKLPFVATLTASDASLLWSETIAAYEIAHLEHELRELQESMTHSMDEASYQQLVELQQTLHNARARRTFAPAESDVA